MTVRGDEINPWRPGELKPGSGVYKMRGATSVDKVPTEKFGKMSLDEAIAKYQEMQAIVNDLAFKEQQINDLLKEKQKLTDDHKKNLDKREADRDAAAASLKLKEQFLPAIARSKGMGAGGIPSDSLVRVGNFLGSSRGKIESLAQQQSDLMRQFLPFLPIIAANTRPGPVGGSSWSCTSPMSPF